jgi:hypothetical protein
MSFHVGLLNERFAANGTHWKYTKSDKSRGFFDLPTEVFFASMQLLVPTQAVHPRERFVASDAEEILVGFWFHFSEVFQAERIGK